MINNFEHADRQVRFIASQIGYREVINGRTGVWAPTDDPRELVRRWNLLDALGSDFLNAGNVLHGALRSYVAAISQELLAAEAAQ